MNLHNRLPHLQIRPRLATRLITAAAVVTAPAAATRAQAPPKPVMGPAYLTADTVVAASLMPQQLLTNPAIAMLPVEVASAAGVKYLGMATDKITNAVVIAEPLKDGAPSYAVFLKATEKWNLATFTWELTAHTRPGQIGGRDCLVSLAPPLPSYVVPKGKTLILGSQDMLQKLMAGQEIESVIATLVKNRPAGDDLYIALDVERLRPLIQAWLSQAGQLVKQEFQAILEVPERVQSAEFTFSLGGEDPSRLVLHTASETDAEQVEALIDDGLLALAAALREQAEVGIGQLRASGDPVQQAMAAYADRLATSYFGLFEPERNGASVVLFDSLRSEEGKQAIQLAGVGLLVALLAPAVQAAQASAMRQAAQQPPPPEVPRP